MLKKIKQIFNYRKLWKHQKNRNKLLVKKINKMETLNSVFIFKYVETLELKCKKQKEVIDKAINNSQYWIDYYTRLNSDERIALRLQENIDILKEVE